MGLISSLILVKHMKKESMNIINAMENKKDNTICAGDIKRYCIHCGSPITNEPARFCSACGKEI